MQDCVAIIDIGSNAVRLVVYDAADRAPIRLHTERVICNLGADLSATGRLNPDAAVRALMTLKRYAALTVAMKVGTVRAVATAALRDAKDGQDFIDLVYKECGLAIAVIDGEEEARLSALGVMSNGVGGDCVIGDYGGGSLELIVVRGGAVVRKGSLPIGSHRLLAEKGKPARARLIAAHLDVADFLKDCTGLDFYALGGAWRSMAKAHMRLREHPLPLLDHYGIEGRKALAFARYVGGRNNARLEKVAGLSARRIGDMAVAALAMEMLFRRLKPSRLVFSGTGLREGLLFDGMDAVAMQADPLLTSASKIGACAGRFGSAEPFVDMYEWLKPLFAGHDANAHRLVEASCLISDIAWLDPEDEQGLQGFRRTLTLPFYGADHPARAFLAVAQYARHRGRFDDQTAKIESVAGAKLAAIALTAGLGQRLAYILTGGAFDLLAQMKLEITPRNVVLLLEGDMAPLNSGLVEDAMEKLAASMKKTHVVVVN